jgi:hypothetical protein
MVEKHGDCLQLLTQNRFLFLRWINPSDCVDMDCDGRRQVLITDIDGSFTGNAGNTIIPKAEYQWGGDPRYGLGMNLKVPTITQLQREDYNTDSTYESNILAIFPLMFSCYSLGSTS